MTTTKIIGVGNQKGGVCKTTNTLHLAAALGERGRKCLMVDLDPNLGLTESLDIPTTVLGTFHMLLGEQPAEDVIISSDSRQECASRPGEVITLPKNVDVIPANRRIEKFEEEFKAAAAEDEELKFLAPFDTLQGPLETLAGKYDYIFLDTPPNAGTLTIATYKTAQWFLLSSTAEDLAVKALRRAIKDIIAAKNKVNPSLQIAGVVMSQVDMRKKLQRAYVEKVKKDMAAAGGFGVFETIVPQRAVVSKASTLSCSVFEYEPSSSEVETTDEIREVYRYLARDLEARISGEAKINTTEDVQEAVNG